MSTDEKQSDHLIEGHHQQSLLTLIESLQSEIQHLHAQLAGPKKLTYAEVAQVCRVIEHRLHLLGTACAKKDLTDYVSSQAPALVPDPSMKQDEAVQLKGLSEPNSPMCDIIIYRHPLSEIGYIASFLFLSVLAFYASAQYPWSVQYVSFGQWLMIPIPFFALVPLVIGAFVVHRLYDCRYVISHDHVRAVSGLLSLSEKDVRVDYENVRGIQVDMSLIQKAFQLGDVYIGSSMHADVEIIMRGVLYPRRIREEIEERIKHHFARLSRNTIVERVRAIQPSYEE
ncbi:MAG: PH domain-containing protein [Bdellovibrionales bacterium]|nr:PH domain-containing protein [Bdellovibrionales bacterium]